ncbi:MAG: CBU_0592 family membrane protein [Caulobacter sp.]
MIWTDVVGVVGVLLVLAAYAAAALGKLDVKGASSLFANFLGASLILLSLTVDFNLSALLMEGSWALVSLIGLIRVLVLRRRPGGAR